LAFKLAVSVLLSFPLAVRERWGRIRVMHLHLVHWGWIWEIDGTDR
jgi:hypothetical protein